MTCTCIINTQGHNIYKICFCRWCELVYIPTCSLIHFHFPKLRTGVAAEFVMNEKGNRIRRSLCVTASSLPPWPHHQDDADSGLKGGVVNAAQCHFAICEGAKSAKNAIKGV